MNGLWCRKYRNIAHLCLVKKRKVISQKVPFRCSDCCTSAYPVASIQGHSTKCARSSACPGFRQKGPNIRDSLPYQLPATQKWRPNVAPTSHLGSRVETEQCVSTLGDLKSTCKRQSCHTLVTGHWDIILLTENEHKLVEELKRHSQGAVGISSTQGRRQDVKAGMAKNHKGGTFLNTILNVCSNHHEKVACDM